MDAAFTFLPFMVAVATANKATKRELLPRFPVFTRQGE
jgi:hypothetical protein